jgi:hypothetical protein
MSNEQNDQNVSRRGFLKVAAATAVAATATGAGAALLKKPTQSLPTASVPQTAPVASVSPVTQAVTHASGETGTDLLARLAEVQAENVRLQAALDAAQRRLESLQQVNGDNDSAAETLAMELQSANQRVSVLSGLVALYEELEEIDVSDTVDQGLAAVSTTLVGLLEKVPTLTEGIEIGQQALTNVEMHIPLLENGRSWLVSHLERLQAYFDAVANLLEKAVDTVGPFLQMLNQWFQDVLKWLPFNLGQRASEIMQALTDLLAETPHTISGLNTNIIQPLDVWLGGETGDVPLHQTLIKPVREQVLAKASETVAQVQQVDTVYQTQLAEPAQRAFDSRRAIRQQIAEYRQQHEV